MTLEPPPPPKPPAERPGQFSLAALLIATAGAAILLGIARGVFAAQGELALWITAPLLLTGAFYFALRLPFIVSAILKRRAHYQALQQYRADLAQWTRERKTWD